MSGLSNTVNYLVPAAGTTHAFPIFATFVAGQVSGINFDEKNIDGQRFMPSGVIIDNTLGTQDFVVTITNTGFRIVCPVGRMCQMPYSAPTSQQVNIQGEGPVSLQFVDYPVIPFMSTATGGGTAVTIANGADVALGSTTDAAVTNPGIAATVVSLLKGVITSLFGTGAASQNIQGNSASAAADVGNPVKVGGIYTLAPGSVATGQRSDLLVNSQGAVAISGRTLVSTTPSLGSSIIPISDAQGASGALLVLGTGQVSTGTPPSRANGTIAAPLLTAYGAQIARPFSIPEQDWNYVAAAGGIVNTTAVPIKTAAGASIRNYLTGIVYQNTSAVASEITILDGVSVIWRGMASASMIIPAAITFPSPLKSTANAALNVQMGTTATVTYVNAQGYTAP